MIQPLDIKCRLDRNHDEMMSLSMRSMEPVKFI